MLRCTAQPGPEASVSASTSPSRLCSAAHLRVRVLIIPHAEVHGAAGPRSICFRVRQPFEALLRSAPQGEGLLEFYPGLRLNAGAEGVFDQFHLGYEISDFDELVLGVAARNHDMFVGGLVF
jgi:hypothetical protein